MKTNTAWVPIMDFPMYMEKVTPFSVTTFIG